MKSTLKGLLLIWLVINATLIVKVAASDFDPRPTARKAYGLVLEHNKIFPGQRFGRWAGRVGRSSYEAALDEAQ